MDAHFRPGTRIKEMALKVVPSTSSPLSTQDYPESRERQATTISSSESISGANMTTLPSTRPFSRIDYSFLSQSSDGTAPTAMNCMSSRNSLPSASTGTSKDALDQAQPTEAVSDKSVSSSQSGHDMVTLEIHNPLMDSSNRSTESTEFNLLLNDRVKNIRVDSEGNRPSEVLFNKGSGPRKSWTPNLSPSLSPKKSSDPRYFSRDFKPPLSNSSNHSTASTESNLIIEPRGHQFSGYGRPDTFVTPTGAGQRRSWKPKDSPKMSPKLDKVQRVSCPPLSARSDHSVPYQSKSPLIDDRTPARDQGDRRMVIGNTFLSSVAPPWHSDETRIGISDSKTGNSSSPKRSSAPLSGRNPRAAMSLSPLPTHRATISTLGKVTDLEALPPAFRAAFRSSSPAMEKMEQSSIPTHKKRWSYDPSIVERVTPVPKEKLLPSKLNYQWPPQKPSTLQRLPNLSFLRVFDFNTDARTVKERRRVFEGDDTRSSTTFPSTVDRSLGLYPDQKLNDNEVPMDTPDHQVDTIETLNASDGDDLDPGSLPKGSIHLDEDTVNCHELVSALKIRTSLKVRWGGPTYRMIDGRPLHYNGTYTDESGNEVDFAPLLEDRFGENSRDKSLVVPLRSRDSSNGDVPLSCPRRSYDDWSDDDSSFSGDSHFADEILSPPDDKGMLLPLDVLPSLWLAPILPNGTVQSDESIDLWRMKRVWDDPIIDDKEPEHHVHTADVMMKVKELLGIPGENNNTNINTNVNIADNSKYDPDASMWCIKKVYDIDGEIHEASETVKVNEKRLSMSFREVAALSSAINPPDHIGSNDELQSEKSNISSHDNGDPTNLVSRRIESTAEPASARSVVQDEMKALPDYCNSKVGTISPRSKRSKSSKKEQSIWDLLSPPPVSFVVESEPP